MDAPPDPIRALLEKHLSLPKPKGSRPAGNEKLSLQTNRALGRLGKGLRIARKARRLTQAQLAMRAGISRKTVIALESGAGSPSLAAFAEVMTVLNPDLLPTLCDFVESDQTTRALLEMRLPAAVRVQKRFVDVPSR
jgi:DNA-binding XRE family transcriptional regulator